MKNKVSCKYCGHIQEWIFEAGMYDCESMDDIIEYDIEYTCNKCGCNNRINEAIIN